MRYLIKHQGAFVSGFKPARLRFAGSSKGAAFIPKQLGLEQITWQRSAVDFDEWPNAARRLGVDE